MTTQIAGRTITVLGRPSWSRRGDVSARLAALGATMRQGLTRRTDLVVMGRGAFRLLPQGRLQARLAQADRQRVPCISEGQLRRAIGLAAPLPAGHRDLTLEALADKARLDVGVARMLVLFDILAEVDGRFGFRDLVAGRQVARLLAAGIDLDEVVRAGIVLARLRGAGEEPTLAQLKLVRTEQGELALRFGDRLAELDGQLRMPLPDADNPEPDDLFHEAEEAEAAGDLDVAATLYARCIDLDKSDPTARFNLANVLRAQARAVDAMQCLKVAVAIDPAFSEAWYNLADLAEGVGDLATAQGYLEKALEADPDYADAVYNLASLHLRAGAFADAMAGWRRYLALDSDSEWSRRAREGLVLCQQHMVLPH